jgi:uncharacterized protein with ParB-like and HNH nuclease domain
LEIKTFKFEQISIFDLLKNVEKGTLKLPFFQRSFKWGTKDIKGLVASLLLGLPI